MKHAIFLAVIIWGFCLNAIGQEKVDYKPSDSLRVTSLLKQARHLGKDKNLMIYFARQLRGIPYVAKTLEVNPSEQLVVNLRQLDCTTYVETVMALTLCAREQSIRFEDYCRWLRTIRYEQGKIGYTRRLHYFTSWIDDNTEMGLIKEISHKGRPFTGRQRLNIDFMSTHSHLYPMLHGKPKAIKEIRDTEQKLTGRIVAYIPKKSIDNSTLMRQTIKDGDILAITTSKQGLDTSHIGIAVWHADGLHLLNASQIRHKVVEEPMTLTVYMSKHPKQTGIRVIRIKVD